MASKHTSGKVIEKTPAFKGGIDFLEGGVLYGWAVAIQKISDPVDVAVYMKGSLLGTGVADFFRRDLKEGGVSPNGISGFQIELNQDEFVDGEPIELRELKTNERIKSNVFSIPTGFDQWFNGEILQVIGNKLVFILESDKSLADKMLGVRVDGQFITGESISTTETRLQREIYLPAALLDGKRHLIELYFKGYYKRLGGGFFELNPLMTPWQYLKDSYKTPGFMGVPAQADARYESLDFHLEAAAKDKHFISLKDLSLVHRLVVESHEGRKNFPKFSLPKFSKPKVSIIVPAYNKFSLSYHCIASIALAFNQTPYEVILADDCSNDETSRAEEIITNLVVSRNPENLRFLRSCNRASEMAKGEYLIFLNNDTEVTSFWIDELLRPYEHMENVGLTGSMLLNTDGSLQEAGGIVWNTGQPWNVGRDANPWQPEYHYVRQVDYLSGASLCIPKVIWEEVGRFSDELAPAYYEDTDLAFKVRDVGYKTVYTPFSKVVHFEGQSHGTDVTKGLKRYQVINEKTFRSKWFKAYKHNGVPSLDNLKLEKDRNIDHRVLVIDYATPIPHNDAGSYAAVQEMKLIASLGFKVTFVPENLAHFGKHTAELQKMGVEVLYSPFYLSLDDVLDRRLAEMSAVYITRYSVAEKYIDRIKQAGKPVVFNNADLHFLREMRAALRGQRDEQAVQQALVTRDKELAVCQKADAVLTYNTTEQAVITSHILEHEKLFTTPWVLEEKSPGLPYLEREGIAFLGGYRHPPNVDAVKYLVGEVMPLLLKQRSDIVLYVYGSHMPDSFKEYESDHIKMVGFAESLDDVYHKHRVFVAPLLSGAGIKGKVLEAMAYGVPCVLSEVAAEGTGLSDEISMLLSGSDTDCVAGIIRLYDDEDLWLSVSKNELTLVERQFSFMNGCKAFKNMFSSIGLFS